VTSIIRLSVGRNRSRQHRNPLGYGRDQTLRRSTAGKRARPTAIAGYVKEVLDGDSAGPGAEANWPRNGPEWPRNSPENGYFKVFSSRRKSPICRAFPNRDLPRSGIIIRVSGVRVPPPALGKAPQIGSFLFSGTCYAGLISSEDFPSGLSNGSTAHIRARAARSARSSSKAAQARGSAPSTASCAPAFDAPTDPARSGASSRRGGRSKLHRWRHVLGCAEAAQRGRSGWHRLRDAQGALHALVGVAGDRADVLVCAFLELHLQGRG
jgi:hypothetical protein